MLESLRFRIPTGLEGFFSILGTGLHLVQLTGRIPSMPEGQRVRVRITLSDEDLARVDQIARTHGISRNAAVVAGLQWATRANVLPERASVGDASAASPGISSERSGGRRSA
ncbi:hypothetical protein [Desertibaculum subflavum]|uniref:hypothetical protein n=1 Tax=Desertibaculum subflavum TaxID=2268458 RepID=UPI000E67083C